MAALSNGFLVNNFLHQIDEEWAIELVGLHMKVQGYWWNWWSEMDEEKREFYAGLF